MTKEVRNPNYRKRLHTVAALFCPEGTSENSPAFQRWVGREKVPSPEGTTEACPRRRTNCRYVFTVMPERSGGHLGCRRGRHLAARTRRAKAESTFPNHSLFPPGKMPGSTAGRSNPTPHPSAVPSGLVRQTGCFPALKRRAILEMSLRDKGTW